MNTIKIPMNLQKTDAKLYVYLDELNGTHGSEPGTNGLIYNPVNNRRDAEALVKMLKKYNDAVEIIEVKQ